MKNGQAQSRTESGARNVDKAGGNEEKKKRNERLSAVMNECRGRLGPNRREVKRAEERNRRVQNCSSSNSQFTPAAHDAAPSPSASLTILPEGHFET